jgi:bla regulator protein blaR1
MTSRLWLAGLGIASLAAQTPDEEDWQKAAGGKMAFEVASVRPSKVPRGPAFPLDAANAKTPGGRFSAALILPMYIDFAFKLRPNPEQYRILTHLPESVSKDFYDIEARAPGNPTKDQMRLMMQSLLAERFKLAVHFETREVPVYALTLVKPEKLGPKLRPHAEGPPCPEAFIDLDPRIPLKSGEVFPPNCEAAEGRGTLDGTRLLGSRNTTMPLIADMIYATGALAGEVDKPVVDRTGLNGRFDYTIQYMPGENDLLARSLPAGANRPPENSEGAPFLRAVREQLGLKLTPSRGQVRVLIVDHVEPPSEN